MLKQCLVSRHELHNNYFISGFLFHGNITQFHDFFSTQVLIQDFRGSEKSKDKFQVFSGLETLLIFQLEYSGI